MNTALMMYLLAVINPFAQVLYLRELVHTHRPGAFARVYWRASVQSYLIFCCFALSGDWLLRHLFQVRLESLQVFGGLVILLVALRYFTNGVDRHKLFEDTGQDLAPRIALPFLVGPGTIWISILIGDAHAQPWPLLAIALVLACNCLMVALMQAFIHLATANGESVAAKYLMLLMRTNALFVGAIGVDMVLAGVTTWLR